MSRQKRKSRKRKNTRAAKNTTPLSGHRQINRRLIPPVMATELGDILQFVSWTNDRLPEMLWAALILDSVDRGQALGQFRRILEYVRGHNQKEQLCDLSLTGIARLGETIRSEFIGFITEPPDVRRALCNLLLYDALPGKESWQKHLSLTDSDFSSLMSAVGAVLWHQSTEATDCRWLRVMAPMMAGKLHFRSGLQTPFHLLNYPNSQDEAKARSAIRATEAALSVLGQVDLTWPRDFWQESWVNTPCISMGHRFSPTSVDVIVTRQAISGLRVKLEDHWQQTHTTTEIDAKHDAVFGMTFYCLRILEEMMGIGIGTGVLGRLGLRTILEVRINLQYLMTEDSIELWKKWREYGAGQAKLNALKFDEYTEPPQYIDHETIKVIASEDIWEEYLTINLASWSGLDLRKISEKSESKGTYDQHYSWTSGYSHGMWGAVRESSYQTCVNPLHRLHRHLERQDLKDVVEDAAVLVDEVLELVDDAYPNFGCRLKIEK